MSIYRPEYIETCETLQSSTTIQNMPQKYQVFTVYYLKNEVTSTVSEGHSIKYSLSMIRGTP